MERIEELIAKQSLKCSNCGKEIMDEWEYHDNEEFAMIVTVFL